MRGEHGVRLSNLKRLFFRSGCVPHCTTAIAAISGRWSIIVMTGVRVDSARDTGVEGAPAYGFASYLLTNVLCNYRKNIGPLKTG